MGEIVHHCPRGRRAEASRAQTVLGSREQPTGLFGSCGTARETPPPAFPAALPLLPLYVTFSELNRRTLRHPPQPAGLMMQYTTAVAIVRKVNYHLVRNTRIRPKSQKGLRLQKLEVQEIMDDKKLSEIVELLTKDNLDLLLRANVADYRQASRADSLTPDDTAEAKRFDDLVTLIRFINSKAVLYSPITAIPREHEPWVFVSYELNAMVERLTERTSAHSSNYERLERFLQSGQPFSPFIEDIAYAAQRDGFLASYDDVKEWIGSDSVSPWDPKLKSALRFVYFSIVQAQSGAVEILSTIEKIFKTLASFEAEHDGKCFQRDSEYYPGQRGPVADILQDSSVGNIFRQELKAAKANGLPSILEVVAICDWILQFRPFGNFSSLMELIIRAALLRQIDQPVLSGVPFLKLMDGWSRGLIPHVPGDALPQNATKTTPYGIDTTAFYHQAVVILTRGLSDLERTLDKLEERQTKLHELVATDPRLTLRQQKALCMFLDDRRLVCDSSYYCAQLDTTAVTARSDLNKLSKMGFLYTKTEGRKLSYRLSPQFESAFLLPQ